MAACVTVGIEGWEFKKPKTPAHIEPRSLEWHCGGCRHWYIWPHAYKPPRRLQRQFKWRAVSAKVEPK